MVYLVGAILLVLTLRAWAKNIHLLIKRKKNLTPTDKVLNYPLLFLWLLFMTVFSVGMIVNN